MKALKWSLLLLVLILLSACKSTDEPVSSITKDKDELRLESHGYLLLGVDTNYSLKSINLSGRSDIILSHLDLTKGSNFILIKAAAGEYSVDQIYLNTYSYFDFQDDNKWSIAIEAQTISYVGHIELNAQRVGRRRASVELVNRSTEAIDFLTNDFPAILQSRKLVYGGPGEDDFFNYIGKQGE